MRARLKYPSLALTDSWQSKTSVNVSPKKPVKADTAAQTRSLLSSLPKLAWPAQVKLTNRWEASFFMVITIMGYVLKQKQPSRWERLSSICADIVGELGGRGLGLSLAALPRRKTPLALDLFNPQRGIVLAMAVFNAVALASFILKDYYLARAVLLYDLCRDFSPI